jgi:hypothetical protein
MTLDQLEAIIWSQARNLNSTDTLIRRTAMDAVRVAIRAHAEHAAGRIVAARRRTLREAS